MKFSYYDFIPALINANVFDQQEQSLLIKVQELSLEELALKTDSLKLPANLTVKEQQRIINYIIGKTSAKIAKAEGISASALKHTHRKIEVMRELLFLYWMKDIYPETNDFDLIKFHSYFSGVIIPRNRAFKYLRVGLNQRDKLEWVVVTNLKSPEVNKSTEMIRQRYSNPYLAAVDMYLGIEKNEGPLKLSKPENSR